MNKKQSEIYDRIQAISDADDLLHRASEYPDYYEEEEIKQAETTRGENLRAILKEFE